MAKTNPSNTEGNGARKGTGALEAILTGLNDLARRLGEVSDQAKTRLAGSDEGDTQTDEKTDQNSGGKPRGVFGFSVKLGLGGNDFRVEPFGNVRRNATSGEPVIEWEREPLVDVFDEQTRLLIIAEMPGIDTNDVHVDIHDRMLVLSAESDSVKYRKQIDVPENLKKAALRVSSKNGIVEIDCPKET